MRAARMLLVTMMRMMLQFLKLLLHVIAVSVVHDVPHDAAEKERLGVHPQVFDPH